MRRVRVEEVERIVASSSDSRELRLGAVAALRRQMQVDWFAFVATDPRTQVGVDPVAVMPDGARLPAIIRSKYLTAHHRWTGLAGAARLGDDQDASRVWREVQAGYGVVDVLSCVLRDGHGTWGFLDLWSTRSFTTADVALLDEVSPTLTAGLRFQQAQALRPRGARADRGPVVLMLDEDLTVTGSTDAALNWLASLLPPAAQAAPVPAVAWNVAAQLLAVEDEVDDHEPRGRVHLADGIWITVRAARLGSAGLAVSMEQVSAADRVDLVDRAFGLTARESSVLAEVCAGRTNAEMAAALHLSVLTVQDHLKSIYARTAVHTRGELAALALGVAPPP